MAFTIIYWNVGIKSKTIDHYNDSASTEFIVNRYDVVRRDRHIYGYTK